MPQQAQQWSPVESHAATADALQPPWMQYGGPLPWQLTEGTGAVVPWTVQMQGSMMENMVSVSGHNAIGVRSNFQHGACPSDMMLHDEQVQAEQMFRQASTPFKERKSSAPKHQRPRLAKSSVGTGSEQGDSSTLQASTRVKTKVEPLHKETPHQGLETGIGKAKPSRTESQHCGDANDLGQDIASAVANFLANPEGDWEVDDSSSEHFDQGEDQANLDKSSCDESSNQAEDVTDHSASEEQTHACPTPAPNASIKVKVEKPSYQDSKGSSGNIMLPNFRPHPQQHVNSVNQCLDRGRKLCQKLLMVPLPKGIQANHLPGLCISITSCIVNLYKEKRKPTVVAVQQGLRERNFDEIIVQSLLPICARMPDLYQIWVQKDSQACVLLRNQPPSDANLEDPTEVEAQCTPAFLEALTEVINRRFHPSTSFTTGNNSRARPVPVGPPPGLFHAACK
jgi:hypothetical protein